ncbi:hypothetical protein COLO4_12116 [Corchorus olitorius]|uniref:Uncharacterized protein n=1 Tax=Corchorus olitorius TaxID=93759 RepID=A0A1R3K256_9ROSI|nr:hypothetical protein COLO4_12116 [Corchorus olitorius]
MRQRSIRRLQGTPSVIGSVAGSSRSLASGDDLATNQDEPKREAESNFSKDVDNVVKHIESHISALRLCSKLADATKDTVPPMPKSARPMLQAKEHSGKKSELNYAVEPFSDRDELMLIGLGSPRIGKKDDSNGSDQQVFRQSGNDLLDDMASKRRRIQHKEKVQPCKHSVRSQGSQDVNAKVEAGLYVQGLRVPINQHDIAKKPPMSVKMPSATPMSYSRKQLTPQIAKSRPSIPSQSAGSKASVKLITNKKSLSHQVQEERKNGGKGIFRNKTPLYQPKSRSLSRSRSRSPSHRSRHRRSRREHSRRSRSSSPRRRRSRSPSHRRRKSRSPTPRRHRRRTSLSPLPKSPSPAPPINQNNKLQLEAELKLLEEETAKRLEEAIQKNVEERLNSEEVKLDIERRIVEGRKKLFDDVTMRLEKEKQAALAEARRKQEQERREREELDKMLEENRRRVEEAQRREALEQQRKEEERYRELELIQRQKEEAARRKKLEEEEEHANQMKLSGKNKSSRPKVPFGIGL